MILSNYSKDEEELQPQPLEPPAAGRLREIQVPTLVVVGDLDTSGTLAMADVLERGIAGARKVVYPGAAHMLPMEQPARFNRLVLDFLQTASSS